VTLREALAAAARPSPNSYRFHLCCGFEPLHLIPFSKAHLRKVLPGDQQVQPVPGQFGDLAGNIERALTSEGSDPVVVVLEWVDLDPRLGMREPYRWVADLESSLANEAELRLARIEDLLSSAAAKRSIVLFRPASPFPVWLRGVPAHCPLLMLRLERLLADFAVRCAEASVTVAQPFGDMSAYDFRAHLTSGFPYTTAFTDRLAARMAELLSPPSPKKGLVTDLDNTVWLGVVGDDGPENVHWTIENGARIHGAYQQLLAGLATQGVLVGIASKNDPEPVRSALDRSDLLMDRDALFPVITSWGAKSEMLLRIAEVWNIGLDAIVFVDDNPLEISEVQQRFPEVECLLFTPSDANAALGLMETLAAKFARSRVGEEDRIRSRSLRASAAIRESGQAADPETLLRGLDARIVCGFRVEPFDARAFELLNKTNQFNLNGRRWQEADFRQTTCLPESVLCVAAYEDRFGPLGKIAVAIGRVDGRTLRLQSWVMSCRAFARRIEFATLRALFDETGAERIEFEWQSTPRNGPTRELLEALLGPVPESGLLWLCRSDFERRTPTLYAAVERSPRWSP
jgi:FkbH-like protein